MKIVSLLPAASEILCDLGVIDNIHAVSHECNYPKEIDIIEKVSSSSIDPTGSQGEIDHQVRETLLDSLLGLGIDAWELESQEEGHAIHLLFNDEDAPTAVGRLTECFELLDAD